jgi:hypothetical protein
VTEPTTDTPDDDDARIQSPRLWRDGEWTAQVIKNEHDDGWAVAMIQAGQAEPALVGPWTMGRDKKNPKPLDGAAFSTLVKTASEVLRRHEQQRDAQLHQKVTLNTDSARLLISLDIVPDDDDPSALLTAHDETNDQQLAQVRVAPSFKLNARSAQAWVDNGFAKPR